MIRQTPLYLLGVLAIACDQPEPKCNVARGSFWAKYTLVSGDGQCATLVGEQLDIQSYYAPRSRSDQRPDYDNASIAIQPMSITGALWNAAGFAEPEPGGVPYAMGRFSTTSPDSQAFCQAPELSAASLRLPAVDAYEVDMCTTAPAAPAYDLRYTFSNVRVYFTPSAIGTQLEADLEYTQDDCTARYKVSAVYPMVSCGATEPLPVDEADGGAEEPPAGDDSDAGEPCPPPPPPTTDPEADDSLCEG
ncbi:MAG: hypothetical protein ABW321_33045, partial [Polyangiales bacterium]